MLGQRARRNKEAQHLLFHLKEFIGPPLLDLRQHPLIQILGVAAVGKQTGLSAAAIGLGPVALGQGAVQNNGQLAAGRAKGVEGAALDEAVDDRPVDLPQVDALGEVEQRRERPAFTTGLDDCLDRLLADALDRRQAETDRPLDDREPTVRLVGVRRTDLDVHPPALGDVLHHLVGGR